MRHLRLVSLCSLLKRFSSIANERYHHQLCKFSSCGPPYSSIWAGNDPTDFAAALSLSENSMSFTLGTQVHGHVIKLGFAEDIFSQNNLIKMYKKFGVLDDGFKLFNEMPNRNLVSWTLIISGAIQLGYFEVGFEMFMEMTRTGLLPNEFAVGSIMKACTSMGASDFGSCVHCFALKTGLEINPFVGCSILNFYAKLGDIVAGERIFESLNYVDIGCCNSMIGAYAQCGYGLEALNQLSSMRWNRITMDKFTFVNVLQGCTDLGDTDIGKQIHGLILRSEMEFDTSVMNALMDMYFQNGGRESAWKVFRRMLNKDVVSWNTVFGWASQYEDPREVARLYHEFIGTGMRPNFVTFSGLFRQCSQLSELNLGLQFFCHALCFGFFNESTVVCSLINMFSRCGRMEMACLVFESRLLTDITPWNELISGHNLNYHEGEALHIFCKLWELGVDANEFTFCSILESCSRYEDRKMCRHIHAALIKSGFAYHGYVCNSLVECYIKLGLLDDSSKLFCSLEKLDIACWGTMVSALVHQGYNCEAIRFLRFMIGVGEKPDEFVMGSIFNSCAEIAAYQQSISVHPFAIKMGYDANVFVASALIDAYAKCGDIGSARMAFDQSYHSNDLITYNTMIMAYACNGLVSEAMDIFETMKSANLQPSQATFVSLLSACGHRGLVDQGRLLFESMHLKYGLVPSPANYGCLVDMLSRNGYLEEAKHIIEVMPFPPWPAIFRSLLSGCRIHGNRKLGEWGAKKLLELVPKNNAAYILLTKVYSERSSWEDVEKVQRIMMERRVSKDAGCSWIET